MSNINLLALDVDTLFEQYSVTDIEIIQRKIQQDVESKKEELRTMVGERYRDLIKAADTITAMKESSESLMNLVENIHTSGDIFSDPNFFNLEVNEDAVENIRARSATKQLNNYFSTMVQIKLLTSLPELIWSNLDAEHFSAATELFIFSRHISTGLQLDAYNPLMKNLPVAKKLWEILKPFQFTIKQNVITILEREELSVDVAVDSLLSLLFLEKSNLNSLLQTLLQLRCAAFRNSLTVSVKLESRQRIKERILASLNILNSTIELLGSCFLDNGLFFQKLTELSSTEASPSISLMDSDDIQFAYLLPDIISNFRPKFELQTLNIEQAHKALQQWLKDTQKIAETELKNLFELVNTMSTIQEIKITTENDRKNQNFKYVFEKLQIKQSFDFYELQYVPLINQRIRNLISNSWQQAIQTTFTSLKDALNDDNKLQTQIWLESGDDLPQSLAEALSEDRKTKMLLMKTKGYNTKIVDICTTFDIQLTNIVNEMNILLEEQTTKSEDKLILIEFLRDTAQLQLTTFVTNIKGLNLSKDQQYELLFVVRMLAALIELCPHLKICFCQQSSWRQWIGNYAISNLDYWNRICQLLEEETFNFWQIFIDSILIEYHCDKYLSQNITHNIVLEDFLNWDVIVLEQKDDQENIINSTIRIPNQPRIALQLYLFKLIHNLNEIVPQTLPIQVLNNFNLKLIQQLLQHYDMLTQQASIKISQNIALQLYFDLKFLQNAFAIGREERVLNEKFQSLQNILKDVIDPFDFELFAEHITINVKRAVVRSQCQLGVLIPQMTTINTTSAKLTQDKEPNVLSLSTSSSTSLWFPLLPIITPNVNAGYSNDTIKKNAIQNEEKQTTPTRKATNTTTRKSENKPKSSAASFFGAMSQDWFR